jgi:hypothetical protein
MANIWSFVFSRLTSARAGAPVCRRHPDRRESTPRSDAPWPHAALPPLDALGLRSIEARAETAPPHCLRRWIADIDEQLASMKPADRASAAALRLKLAHLVEEPRIQGPSRMAAWRSGASSDTGR